jgi:type IV pilus assembly protein PilO
MALSAERIAKLPISQKLLILGGVVILIFVVYYLTLESSYKSESERLNTNLANLKADIVKIRAIAAEKEKFERENALLEKKLKEALAKLPNETEIAAMLIKISELGRDNGLTFSNFQPGKETPRQLYVQVPINMKFKGNFFHVLRFFDEVSKLSRIVNISNLSIRQARTEMLDITCTAETYKFKETPAVPAKGKR